MTLVLQNTFLQIRAEGSAVRRSRSQPVAEKQVFQIVEFEQLWCEDRDSAAIEEPLTEHVAEANAQAHGPQAAELPAPAVAQPVDTLYRRGRAPKPVLAGEEVRTIMLRNIPNRCKESDIALFLNSNGFAGRYYGMLIPSDRITQRNRGYVFVRFHTHHDFLRAMVQLPGTRFQGTFSAKTTKVSPATQHFTPGAFDGDFA
eukprot:CAMPEP_0204350272 /NCGR_PEP_ID=MMETSP0469-20131031/30196_1 /ASSEMBLY_ACC=CAM_ASM_000384 /TAXON_ID=2969 /ORGANISM="Oxyrrhis marina" /LENGTH=200 /DNA_ID=CAMNT_0051336595 /DNA_START=14 /DNA_END=616 /DNA_ORIENTATION=+